MILKRVYIPGVRLCKSSLAVRTPRIPTPRLGTFYIHTHICMYISCGLSYEFIFGDETTNGFNCRFGHRAPMRSLSLDTADTGGILRSCPSVPCYLCFGSGPTTRDKRASLTFIISNLYMHKYVSSFRARILR